jgi:hypothetical protein
LMQPLGCKSLSVTATYKLHNIGPEMRHSAG